MKKYCINLAMLLLFGLFIVSCSKEIENKNNSLSSSEFKTTKTFVYNDQEFELLFDKDNNIIPTEESDLLTQSISNKPNIVGFSLLGFEGEKTYFFDSEMEGYKYYEDNVDKHIGRKLQIGHATNLLRDKLMNTYGVNLDYNNPQVYADAKNGI